jgi:HEPN domain-containing protein
MADAKKEKSRTVSSPTRGNMSTIDQTPFGFMTYAESYGRAAFIVEKAMDEARMPWPIPVATLALHCVELSLKGVLVKQGMAPDEVRKFGHDINKLFEATPLDWSDIDLKNIEFYSDAVLSQALRYRRKDKPYFVMDLDHLLPFMETVFRRCLKHVSPGANRGVRP